MQNIKPIVMSKDKALTLAIKALESWEKYGQEMRKYGRGGQCTQDATGYSTEYLVQALKNAINN